MYLDSLYKTSRRFQSGRLAIPQELLSARSGSAEVIVRGEYRETFGYVIR